MQSFGSLTRRSKKNQALTTLFLKHSPSLYHSVNVQKKEKICNEKNDGSTPCKLRIGRRIWSRFIHGIKGEKLCPDG